MVASLRLLALLAGEVAAVAALHRLAAVPGLGVPWHDLGAWLAHAPPAEAVVAGLRLVALGAAWWLLAATAAYAVGRLARARTLLRVARPLTPPAVRRLTDHAVAAALAGTLATATLASAAPVPPLPPPVPPSQSETVAEPAGELPAEPRARVDGEHLVAAGDNLWAIAARHLAAARGQPVRALALRDVHAYWLAVIAVNQGNLRSGNPDLIFPGERVLLPPV